MKKFELLLVAMTGYVMVISFLRMYEQNRVMDFVLVTAFLAVSAGVYAALEVVGDDTTRP